MTSLTSMVVTSVMSMVKALPSELLQLAQNTRRQTVLLNPAQAKIISTLPNHRPLSSDVFESLEGWESFYEWIPSGRGVNSGGQPGQPGPTTPQQLPRVTTILPIITTTTTTAVTTALGRNQRQRTPRPRRPKRPGMLCVDQRMRTATNVLYLVPSHDSITQGWS